MKIITAIIANILVSILFFILGYILWKHTPKMNSLFGFRFKNSYKNENAWANINRYGGKKMVQYSIVIALLSLLQIVHYNVLFNLTPSLILIPIFQTYFYSRKF